MNEKKLYKVTITDENGKVVHEVESDCIIAAISDPSKGSKEQSAIHGVYMTNCPGVTIQHTFQALDTVKREAIAKNPALGIMLAMDSLERIAQKHGAKRRRGRGRRRGLTGGVFDLFNEILKRR